MQESLSFEIEALLVDCCINVVVASAATKLMYEISFNYRLPNHYFDYQFIKYETYKIFVQS